MHDFVLLLLALVSGSSGLVGFVFWVRWFAHTANTWAWRRSLVALELRIPHTATTGDIARWVGLVRSLVPQRRAWSLLPRSPFCLETTATHEGIRHVIVVPVSWRTAVLSMVSAAVPGARLVQLGDCLTGGGARVCAAAEIGLKGGGELLAIERAEATSRHLLAALQPLHPGEVVCLQWLFTGARAPRWISRLDVDIDIPGLWQAGPVLGAVARIAVASPGGRARARAVLGRVFAALGGMNTARTRVARRRWLPRFVVIARTVLRMTPPGRWPIVATADELAGLVGLAVGVDALPGVPAEISRALPPQPAMPKTGLVIGRSNYPGTVTAQLHISTVDRLRHMWILGPTGTGKSTLLCNIMSHDIAHGDGLVLIDPGGDLVADVLDRIPDNRVDDVIVIDPTHTDYIIGINPLMVGPGEQAAGFTYHVLQSLWAASWGPRTADIVRACLLTLTATTTPEGSAFTLVDVPELLTNAGFRRYVTTQSLPPQVVRFWRWYDHLPQPQQVSIISPVLNKLRTFTLSTTLRATLGQSAGVSFPDVLANSRIVLVALKKAILGEEVTALLGALVMASVWQAAQTRINQPKEQRPPFWLVADEFQETLRLPLNLQDMAARARSLGLGLMLAHQYIDQLTPTVKAAVLGTIRSHIVFQIGRADASELAPEFTPLTATDLNHLGPFEIAARLCTSGTTAPPVTGTTYPMPHPRRDGAALAATSRARHGLPLSDVDEQITQRITPPTTHTAGRWNRIASGW
jgi:Type IV secretion-system coupling protein DNA-binding domain